MATTMSEALEQLQDEGYKLTDKRKTLLEILSEQDRYLSAREIHETMQNKFPTISFDTIYRNLSTYTDMGLVEETEWNNEKAFRFQCEVDHHHHHFICLDCGKTKELKMCPMDFFQDQLPGYQIEEHRFEIFGLCDECGVA